MEMTRQRKLLLMVAGLGLGGLAVDKLVLGPPASAKADVAAVVQQAPAPAQQPQAEPPADTPIAGTQKTLPSYAVLTERLLQTADQAASGQTGDPFAMPADWLAVITNQSGEPEQRTQSSEWSKRLLEQYRFYGTSADTSVNGIKLAIIGRVNQRQQIVQVGYPIRVDTGKLSAGGERVYELYRLSSIDSHAVIWQSAQEQTRTVEMQITVLDER